MAEEGQQNMSKGMMGIATYRFLSAVGSEVDC